MDACLGWIKDGVNKSIACSAQPATTAEATGTYDLSTSAITSANVTGPADGASGRKITIDAITEASIQHSGDATHIALTRIPATTYVGTGAVSSNTNNSSDTVDCAPSLPEDLQEGDTMVVLVWSVSNGGTDTETSCFGGGWTLEILDNLATTEHHMSVFSKKAGASETDPTIIHTSSAPCTSITVIARMWAFRDTGTGLLVTTGTRAEINDNDITFPGITTAANNVMVLALSVISSQATFTGAISNGNVTFTAAGEEDGILHLHYGTMATAGAIGDTTGQVSQTQYGMYCHVALDVAPEELSFVTTCPTTTLDSAVKLSVDAWDIQISDPV